MLPGADDNTKSRRDTENKRLAIALTRMSWHQPRVVFVPRVFKRSVALARDQSATERLKALQRGVPCNQDLLMWQRSQLLKKNL